MACKHFPITTSIILWGVGTVVVYYANRASKAVEVMRLTPAGKLRRVWGNDDR